MKALSEQEVKQYVTLHLKEWLLENNSIKRDFKFKTFVEAFSFMTAIALEANTMNHHPDWSNSYNKVSVALTTHDAGGITKNDFDLANLIDGIFKNYR